MVSLYFFPEPPQKQVCLYCFFVCIVFEMRTFEEVKTNCNFSVQNWCYFIFCLGTEKKLCFISVLVIKYALPLKTFLIFSQSKQSFIIKDYHDLSIFLSKRCYRMFCSVLTSKRRVVWHVLSCHEEDFLLPGKYREPGFNLLQWANMNIPGE